MPGPLDRILAGTDGAEGAHGPGRGAQAVRIARLVRTVLTLPDDVAVTVQELSCREPGCPPVETVIAVLAASPRRWTMHHPLTAINDEMVTRLLINDPDGGLHDND